MLTVRFYLYPVTDFYRHIHPICNLRYTRPGVDSIKILLIISSSGHLDLRFIEGILKLFVQCHVLAGRQPEKPFVNNKHGSTFCEKYLLGAPSGSNDNHIHYLRLRVSTL
jgi:hypothetical protein